MFILWVITKVTLNNTDLYTKESSQQRFKISSNNVNARFDRYKDDFFLKQTFVILNNLNVRFDNAY